MKRLWFVLCMAGLIFAGGCAGGGILDRASAETVNTRAALVDYMEQCLKEGQEEIAFVTGELTEEDIQSVNLSQEGYYGVCSRYEITEVGLLQKTYVTLYCELSDNYYAENAIKNGMEIPEGRETAAELAAVCEEILAALALEDAGALFLF